MLADCATVVLLGLAGWRISSLLVYEAGPFDVFQHLRNLFQPTVGEITNPIGKMLTCVWCTSVWTVLLVAAIWLVLPEAVYLLAAMTVAILVERLAR